MSRLQAQRCVRPELLDALPPQDQAARRARADLYRVNRLMGSARVLRDALRPAGARRPIAAPLRLLELGAGDGRLMLRVARLLARPASAQAQPWRAVELRLLDRQALLSPQLLDAYARLGWRAAPLICDVLDWIAAPLSGAVHYDVIVANLFLHHFEPAPLRALLAAVAARCERFVACEPRRSGLALLGSRLLGAIGAHRITRHDAVRSVQAGFRGQELSALWPAAGWQLQERRAGPFVHAFCAQRALEAAA